MKEALTLRKRIKAKKPDFIREDSHKRKEVPSRWRRPKGRHSKMRHRFAGHRALPDPGYGSPTAVRGMHPLGLMPVLVHTTAELSALDKKSQGAMIGGGLGNRSRSTLLAKAKELGVTVLNFKNTDDKIKEITDQLASRKEAKKKRADSKAAKSKEKEKAAEKKKEAEKKQTEEEKKEQEKKELDKALIQREK